MYALYALIWCFGPFPFFENDPSGHTQVIASPALLGLLGGAIG